MGQVISDQQALAQWVRAQATHVDIAVAFWGAGAVEELGLHSKRRYRVLLDLSAGASNPFEVQKLLKLGARKVRCVDRLHAKAYISQNQVLVGSANASANGLGAEGAEATHWKELGLLSDDAQAVAQAASWFDELWSEGQRISKEKLAEAEIAWKKRRKQRPVPQGGNLLDVAAKRPEELRDRRIFVNVVTERMDRSDRYELARMEKEAGHPLFAYSYWPAIPLDATLISFTEYQGQRLSRDVPFISRTPPTKKRGKFKFVSPTELSPYAIGPLAEWRMRIRTLRKADPRSWERNGGICLEITEFVSRGKI